MVVGRKDDLGKDPWHLAPWDSFRAVVKVLNFGQRKYAARNWEDGMDWSRPFGALMRHLTAWWERENDGLDEETGYSHLWHAGCCLMFLIAYEIRGVGKDDRPNVTSIKEWRKSYMADDASFDDYPDETIKDRP